MNQSADQNSHSSIEQLYALIDRELDPGAHALVAGHLQACARCRSLYESLVRFDSACQAHPARDAQPRLYAFRYGHARDCSEKSPDLPAPGACRLSFWMLIVLAFMTAAFVLTGVIKTEDVNANSGPAGRSLTR